MMPNRLAMLLALALAAPAFAQEPVFDPTASDECVDRDRDRYEGNACIGLSAEICMSSTDAGGTTLGMGYCYTAEWEYWDARLNAAYSDLMAMEKAEDAAMASDRFTPPSRADALRNMQRAWIPYRDAACEYDYAQWGGGTGGGPASAACMMRLTARQALFLEAQAAGL